MKLYRDILESPIYGNSNAIRLYIHILLKSNIKDKHWNEILIKRGQFLTSESNLQDELNLNRQQIRTSIKTLQKYGFIKKITTKTYTILELETNQETNQEIDQEINQELTKKQPRKSETNKGLEGDGVTRANQEATKKLTNNLTTTKEVKEFKEKEKELNNNIYMCVMEKWNTICSGYFPPIKIINDKRKKQINEILKNFNINDFDIAFNNLTMDDFSIGKNDRGWKADIDYILRVDKFTKFFEKDNIKPKIKSKSDFMDILGGFIGEETSGNEEIIEYTED